MYKYWITGNMRRICGIPGFGNLWTTLWRHTGSLFQRICGDLLPKQLSCGAWTWPSLWFVASFLPPSILFFYFTPVFLLHYLSWFFPILLSSFVWSYYYLKFISIVLSFTSFPLSCCTHHFIFYSTLFNCFNLFPFYLICVLNFCFMYSILPLYVLCTFYPCPSFYLPIGLPCSNSLLWWYCVVPVKGIQCHLT
jgi:hypothetical protein